MGEIAKMMEDGILCQQCGVYIDEDKQIGVWSMCEDCIEEEYDEN